MGKFLTNLHITLTDVPYREDKIWIVTQPLNYYSTLLDQTITVPTLFETDLASVPRFPFVYMLWGGRAHREGVLHDYLYRKDSDPVVTFMMANRIFLSAMKSRNKPFFRRYFLFFGVCIGGYFCYHKKSVYHKF